MIGVIEYGLGNVGSVVAAVEKVGFEPCLTRSPVALRQADKLILPGVGAFGDGMKNLEKYGLIELLNALVLNERKPILGVCLGAQLFAKKGFEFGCNSGLGWIDAEVVRLEVVKSVLRIPHVGWNDMFQVRDCTLFKDIPEDALFYYVHSYHISCKDSTIVKGECEYGIRFASVIQQENIYATQFHVEKSQRNGLRILKNFLIEG